MKSTHPDRGCLPTAAASLALVVLAPAVALLRTFQSKRRGDAWRIERQVRPGPAGRVRIDLEADIPVRSANGFPTRITDTVVRIAEHLRRPDDHYHHIHRIPGEPEALVLPLGPLLQTLGDRLLLSLGQSDLAGRTVLWLTLPARTAISQVLDPEIYNPETEGQPEQLIEESGSRWAAAIGWEQTGPSTLYRVSLWVPESSASGVESLLDRLDTP